MARTGLALLFSALLLGFTPILAEDSPSAASDSETGTVVIYRTSRIVARAYRSPIRLDREPLLDLQNGTYWSGQLPAGTYTLVARDKDVFKDEGDAAQVLEIEVAPGETTYVRAELAMGVRKPNTNLTIVTVEEGSASVAKLKPLRERDVVHPDFKPKN